MTVVDVAYMDFLVDHCSSSNCLNMWHSQKYLAFIYWTSTLLAFIVN